MLPLRSELLFTLTGRVSPTVDIGVSQMGHRRIIPVEGGEFEGPKLRGRVLKGGADWMLVDSEGVAHVDVRMALQTDDGEEISMQYSGRRHGPPAVMGRLERGEAVDPGEYYFRIVPFSRRARRGTPGSTESLPSGSATNSRPAQSITSTRFSSDS